MVMTFDYYYGAQAEQFNFIRIPKAMIVDPMFALTDKSANIGSTIIPKAMIVDPMFADLSVNAKLLCG